MGVRDVKAQSYDDLLNRIEALEARSTGNVTAPKIRGLKIGFNIRHRFEFRTNMPTDGGLGAVTLGTGGIYTRAATTPPFDKNPGRVEAQDFTLQRIRLSLNADVNKNVRAFIMLQDVRAFGDEGGTTANLEATDVQEAYVEARNLGDLSPLLNNLRLRIGRWQAHYGNHRLIGTLNWANQARSYDGASLKWDDKKGNWVDLFAFQIDEKETGAASGQGQGGQDTDEVLYGLYTHFKTIDGVVAEPYIIARVRSAEDTQTPAGGVEAVRGAGTGEQRYTLGFRLDGRNMAALPGVDFTVEPMWQFGKVEGLRIGAGVGPGDLNTRGIFGGNQSEVIQAAAIYAGFGYTFKDMPWSPRIGYAYAWASGDDQPTRGAAKTFDHLYPTGHAQMGYLDMTAFQNIEDHQIHINLKPSKKLVIDTKIHFFNMDEEADNLWNVAGGTGWGDSLVGSGVNRTGSDRFLQGGVSKSVDDELGQEIDITIKYKMFQNFGVVAGYSHFWAGDWLDDTSGGGDQTGVDWFYLQSTVKF
jgi:hypothetical protein